MTNVIMPSGSKQYDWIPEIEGDEANEKIGVDAISDEDLMKLAQLSDIVDVEIEEPGETPEEEDVVEISIGEEDDVEDDLEDDLEDEVEIEDGDFDEVAESPIEELIEAVEDVKEALDEVVEEAQEATDGDVEEEDFEIEIDEDAEEDVDGEFASDDTSEGIADEDALIAITPGEVVDEEECETCQYCGSAKGISSVAGDSRKFTKLAAVSPDNKKQIRTYWVDYLGYDPKYVDAMLTDYEK